jgi:hypothetical protein
VSDQPEALRVADGGPAFPVVDPVTISSYVIPGMTLRDWFASQALAGMVTEYSAKEAKLLARHCYERADAMLEAREVQP